MSVIAVVPDHECDLAVLYASEVHYLIDREFSFFTVELVLTTTGDCQSVLLVLDGVPPDDAKFEKLRASRRFQELLRISQATRLEARSQVWDFRDSFFDESLVTNKAYEGPDEWSRIRTIQVGNTVRFCGAPTRVPRFNWQERRFRTEGDISTLLLTGDPIATDSRVVVRLGFFLKRHSLATGGRLERWWDAQWRHRPRTAFVTQFYTYGAGDLPHLDRLGVRNRLDNSTLWLTLEPFTTTDPQQFGGFARVPTSDIWVVGYGSTSVSVRSPRVRLDEDSVPRATGFGLYAQREDNPSSPFWEAHFVPARHIVQLQEVHHVVPRQDFPYEIEWYGELPGLTLRRILHSALRYLGVPAILTSLILFYFPKEAGSLIPVLLVLYIVIVVASVWAWHNVSAFRRFDDD